jgi:predicted nucleotidyltransferase
MLTPKEVDEAVRRVVERTDPEAVIVFGSYAKGTPTAASDLDLFVVLETERPMAKRADDLKPMFANALIPVDVHVYTPEEVEEYGRIPYAFIRSVLASGRVAYRRPGQDSFVVPPS